MRIGRSWFSAESGEVVRQDGTRVELGQRATKLLELLHHRRGAVISKEELLDAAWRGTTVSEDSLYQSVSEIRHALGADRMLIETVPRRGYRLRHSQSAWWRSDWSRRRATPVAVILILALLLVVFWPSKSPQSRPSIVVLPFEQADPDPRWRLIGRGIASDIAGSLARHGWLDTIAPASAEATQGSPDEVADQLGVRFLLTGTIQTSGEDVRISAVLSDHDSKRVVWSMSATRPADGMFEIQDEIVERVDGALGSLYGGLIAQHDQAATRRHAPRSLDAYENFLLGVEEKHKFTADGYAKAADYLGQAVRLDPEYAAAWATLSLVRSFQASMASPEDVPRLRHLETVAIERAYALDPNDPDVLWRMAMHVARTTGDLDRARRLQRRALELAPNSADVLLIAGWQSVELGFKGPEPFTWSRRAMQLNPRPPQWYLIGHGVAAFCSGEYETALEIFASAPQQLDVVVFGALARARLGNLEGARRDMTRAVEMVPDLSLERIVGPYGIERPEMAELVATARDVGLPVRGDRN